MPRSRMPEMWFLRPSFEFFRIARIIFAKIIYISIICKLYITNYVIFYLLFIICRPHYYICVYECRQVAHIVIFVQHSYSYLIEPWLFTPSCLKCFQGVFMLGLYAVWLCVLNAVRNLDLSLLSHNPIFPFSSIWQLYKWYSATLIAGIIFSCHKKLH